MLKYKRGSPIDDFEKEVKADISSLADVINGDQRPFDHMLSLAAVTREIVNENMWVKAMITVEVRRTDLGFAVPNMLEVMGPSFLPNIKQLDRLAIFSDSAIFYSLRYISLNLFLSALEHEINFQVE